MALIYAALGEKSEAPKWTEEVRQLRMPWYPWLIGWFPQFRTLHDEPEIVALAEELGVPLLPGP